MVGQLDLGDRPAPLGGAQRKPLFGPIRLLPIQALRYEIEGQCELSVVSCQS